MDDHSIHDRSSNRLPEYDYSQPGAYFITIGSYHRKSIFGDIHRGHFFPNPIGRITVSEWYRSELIRKEINLDAFILMPNHLHGIVWITTEMDLYVGATGRSPLQLEQKPTGPAEKSLGSFVAGFKSATTKHINQFRKTPGLPVWQRNYYDRIIRHEQELNRLRQYILQNPLRWEHDRYYFPNSA